MKTETPFYTKLAHILVSIVILSYIAVIGKDVLAPLLFSLLFAVLLLPLSNFFERKLKMPRGIAAFVSILLLLLCISVLMYILGSQLAGLARDWPLLEQNVSATVKQLQTWVEGTFHIDTDKQLTYVNTATSKALSSSANVIGATVMSVSSIVLFDVFILIYTFFLLMYRRLLLRFIVSVFTERNATLVYEITNEVKYIIGKYVVGLFAEICIVILLSIGVYWALGVNYAILLGLITGIINVIPYVGIFTALLLSTLITFATGGTNQTLYVIIATIIIHLIDSNYIMPKVVGSKVRINPLVIILGVIVGEMMWGISGMFLSIPVIAVLKVIFDRIEGFKPWGLLLGDDEHHPRKLVLHKKRIIITRRNEQIITTKGKKE